MIVLRHTGFYFNEFSFTESYLAVDLFFVLSGFVIAEAYSKRLNEGLSSLAFMRIRIIRLYPLYLLGTLLGIIHIAGVILVGNNSEHWSVIELLITASVAILMLPSPINHTLYPINGPSWSLLFELFSNFLYAIFYPFLTTRRLISVIALSSLVLGFLVFKAGNLDAGFYWEDFFVGIPRVLFSFGAGLLIHRFKRNSSSYIPSWLLIAFVFIVLGANPPEYLRPWFDVIAVTFVFPAIIYLASASEPNSILAAKFYSLLGVTSYAIYVLHVPISKLMAGAFQRITSFDVSSFSPYSGVALLFSLVLIAWFINRYYDEPIRRIATNFLRK